MNARSEPTMFLTLTAAMRHRIEATIDQLVALLDEFDGDTDREPDVDDEDTHDAEADDCELEEGGDLEPLLGRSESLHQGSSSYAYSGYDFGHGGG